MLGARPVTLLAWESFGEGWVTDVVRQLKLDATVIRADYGELPDLAAVDPGHDVVFTWNGTTSGVKVPDGEWIRIPARPDHRRRHLRAFARPSLGQDRRRNLQLAEGRGGEGGTECSSGPRAVERLESWSPPGRSQDLRMTKGGK